MEPRQGDCTLYLNHLRENICNDDTVLYEYLITWMADGVQNPSTRPGVAIALRGKRGTGKSVAITQFGKLFGPHFVQVQGPRMLLGNFNAHLSHALIINADEAFWA